jgi:medium-chain acyl-[acyl-carrier-protein] hydrolase
MTTLVEALAKGLEGSLDKPYALFGHSMGGLIAYELIRRLRAGGVPLPVHLFVSARRAPHIVDPEAPIHALPEPEFVNQLVRRYNGVPPAVLREPELMALFLPILRADFQVIETYQWTGDDWFDRPITAFGAIDDPLVSPEHIRAWKDVTSGPFKVHMMSGGHFFLQKSQSQLLRLIAQQLVNRE